MAPTRKPRTRDEALAERRRQQQVWKRMTPVQRAALFGVSHRPTGSYVQTRMDV